jgi:Tol biopolymer transport system component
MFPSSPVPMFQRAALLMTLTGFALLEGCGGRGGNPSPPPPGMVAPAISTEPASLTVTAPQAAAFSVTASGTAPLHYQWRKDGAGVGADAATFSLATTSAADGGSYTVTISNTAGSVTSHAALLTVNPAQTTPVFTLQPVDVTLTEGQTGQFVVAVSGMPTPTLEWQVSVNGGTWSGFGLTTPVYDVVGATVADSGRRYRVAASNSAGTTYSNAATLTVNATTVAPAFTTQPASVTITAGQDAQFAVAASGTPVPTLQWQLSTDNGGTWGDITGATGPLFNVVGATLANNGRQYRAVATNAAGSATSQAAVLTVQAAVPLANIVFQRGYGIESGRDDIYLIKEDGTGEIALATSTEHEFFAAVAPGGRVIYQRITGGQLDLYSVKADGTGTTLLAGTADDEIFAGMTPGGQVIYRRNTAATGRDLYAVNADGTGTVALASSPNHEDFAAITSSGKVIYQVTVGSQTDLYSINADGTGKVALAADPFNYEGLLSVTSTGQILFVSFSPYGMGGIYSIHEDGGPVTTLVTDTVANEFSFAGITQTGQVIIKRNLGSQHDLYGDGTVVLANSLDEETFMGSTATGQVLYQRITPGAGFGGFQYDLYAVDADGTHTTPLGNGPAVDEVFNAVTPDGKVIYTRGTYSNGGDLYIVNADGTGTLPLADTADYEDFKGLTANGRVIYERTGSSSVTHLYAVNTDGTGTTPLSTSGGHAFFVGTTPSGKILFRLQSGNADLYIVNADGTGMTPLANSGNNEFFAAIFP